MRQHQVISVFSNYFLDGDCGSLAVLLKERLGGLVYGLYESKDINNLVPMHYILKMNNGFYVDATGIYRNKKMALKLFMSMFPEELENQTPILYLVDQYTLNNEDYICEISTELVNAANSIVEY